MTTDDLKLVRDVCYVLSTIEAISSALLVLLSELLEKVSVRPGVTYVAEVKVIFLVGCLSGDAHALAVLPGLAMCTFDHSSTYPVMATDAMTECVLVVLVVDSMWRDYFDRHCECPFVVFVLCCIVFVLGI